MLAELFSGYVLIDSNAVIAHLDPTDQHHSEASAGFDLLLHDPEYRLFVTNLTLYESFTRLRYKSGWDKAASMWTFIEQTIKPTIIPFNRKDEIETRVILENVRGVSVSFHDAACANLMINNKIGTAFSFDRDFSILGFDLFPG